MTKIILLSVLIIAIAVVLLCVKLIVKGNTFSSMHIHDSKAMKERGIDCVLEQDAAARRKGTSRLETGQE